MKPNPNQPSTTRQDTKYHCDQCGREMSIMDYILGPICNQCCRENHARACNRPIKIKHSKRLTRESGQAMILLAIPALLFLLVALILILWILGYTPTLPAFM